MISATLMLFFAAMLGVVVGLVTGLLNRPKLTWLQGALLGVLAAIVFGLRDDRPEQLVLTVTGLLAALVAG